jgi:hypothetical protein
VLIRCKSPSKSNCQVYASRRLSNFIRADVQVTVDPTITMTLGTSDEPSTPLPATTRPSRPSTPLSATSRPSTPLSATSRPSTLLPATSHPSTSLPATSHHSTSLPSTSATHPSRPSTPLPANLAARPSRRSTRSSPTATLVAPTTSETTQMMTKKGNKESQVYQPRPAITARYDTVTIVYIIDHLISLFDTVTSVAQSGRPQTRVALSKSSTFTSKALRKLKQR